MQILVGFHGAKLYTCWWTCFLTVLYATCCINCDSKHFRVINSTNVLRAVKNCTCFQHSVQKICKSDCNTMFQRFVAQLFTYFNYSIGMAPTGAVKYETVNLFLTNLLNVLFFHVELPLHVFFTHVKIVQFAHNFQFTQSNKALNIVSLLKSLQMAIAFVFFFFKLNRTRGFQFVRKKFFHKRFLSKQKNIYSFVMY